MLCVLAFVGFGHGWVVGVGNTFYKSCYYDCGEPGGTNGQPYDRRYVINPSANCPARFYEA